MQDLGNKEAEQRYRDAILAAAPKIEQIDAERVNFDIKAGMRQNNGPNWTSKN